MAFPTEPKNRCTATTTKEAQGRRRLGQQYFVRLGRGLAESAKLSPQGTPLGELSLGGARQVRELDNAVVDQHGDQVLDDPDQLQVRRLEFAADFRQPHLAGNKGQKIGIVGRQLFASIGGGVGMKGCDTSLRIAGDKGYSRLSSGGPSSLGPWP